MIRLEKQKKVEELQEQIAKAKYCVLTEYRGLNVENINILRTKIREVGGEYHVVKNTLTEIASKKLGLSGLEGHLKGPTAIAFGYKDESAIIKVLIDFSKKFDNFKIKAGVLDGSSVIDNIMLNKLSMLPAREVLLSQLASCIKGPLFNLANVLQANLQNMVSVVNELKLQKEKEAV